MPFYRIAAPDEYLAITGMGVDTVKICKKAWVLPFQRITRFSVRPHDFGMDLQAMTKEKLQFMLPVVFTVGPYVNQGGGHIRDGAHESLANDNDEHRLADHHTLDHFGHEGGDALLKFATLLTDSSTNGKQQNSQQFVEKIVKGIIEGETRVLVSSMTMEEIFTNREEFKNRIHRNIQTELDQFGLKIYNANVKELKDAPNSSYFESLSRKAHEGATNQARVDVANAQLMGNVQVAQSQGQQERDIAKIHAQTAVQKTVRDSERAQAEAQLATRQTELKRDVDITRIEATRAMEFKDEELKREVEIKRAAAEMERLRATDVVKAQITRESKQQAADAKAYEIEADAKANFTKSKQQAEATVYKTKVDADASQYAMIKNAEASLQQKLKEAQGIEAMAGAYAKLSQAFGGPGGLLQYMMIEKGTYVELAKANAQGIQGLQPKISVWNTGAQGGSDAAGAGGGNQSQVDTMRNIYQMLPPLMTTINEQTGITLPEWQFGRLAGEMSQIERKKQVNGAQ